MHKVYITAQDLATWLSEHWVIGLRKSENSTTYKLICKNMSTLGPCPHSIPTKNKLLTYFAIKYDARGIYNCQRLSPLAIGSLSYCP